MTSTTVNADDPPRGECPECGRHIALKQGLLRTHGSYRDPCPGSRMRPVGASLPPPADQVHPVVQRLRDERLRRGWPQREVAARAGVSQGQISAWETGHQVPTLDRLTWWAGALELELVLVPVARSRDS